MVRGQIDLSFLNPLNWSAGGQKIFGGGPNAQASTPRMAYNPYSTSTPRATQGGMAPGLGKSTSETTDKDKQDAIMAQWQKFFDELNSPLDMNDPYVKNILDNARQTTLTSAGNAGIFGPYSQNLAQQAYIKGAAGLQQQNKALALQALTGMTGQSNNMRDFNYDVAKDQYANKMDLWKYNQDKSSGLGGIIGGGIGALGGGLAGGPAGAMAGWQLGSGVGSAFGGMGSSGPPKFNPGGGY